MIRLKLISFLCILGCLFLTFCNQQRRNKEGGNVYQEPHRPQLHYTPKENWMGPVSGLLYYEGTYHLFYQYNPDTTFMGSMHWGHAVSEDLIHWEHLPIALKPDSLGQILSGSVVLDSNNISGFGKQQDTPMIAMFTYKKQKKNSNNYKYKYTQGLAYSLDGGNSWTKYKNNPILANNKTTLLHPYIFWYEALDKWIMVLAANNHIQLFESPDLKNWNFLSRFGKNIEENMSQWERPVLFPIHADDKNKTQKWVLIISINDGGPSGGSATRYFVGDFDGKNFYYDKVKDKRWLDYGKDNFGGSIFSNIPFQDKQQIFMGWMNNWEYAQLIPTGPWRGAMTFPRKLSLSKINNQYILNSQPLRELNKLRIDSISIEPFYVKNNVRLTDNLTRRKLPIEVIISFQTHNYMRIGTPEQFGIMFSNDTNQLSVGYDKAQRIFYIDRSRTEPKDFSEFFVQSSYAPCDNLDSITKMHLLIDRSSVELHTVNGKKSITARYFNKKEMNNIDLFSRYGSIEFTGGKIYRLKSIWK